MAYIVASDFREATGKHWTKGIRLETTDIADADLTALIASVSTAFDQEVDDHFEPETAATVVVEVNQAGTYPNLEVPKRIRAITSVTVTYPGGNTVSIPATSYVYEVFTGDFTQINRPSRIRAVETAWPFLRWYWGQTVTLVGDFSWPSTPDRVKRAVALMCWDVVHGGVGDYMRYAESVIVDGSTITVPSAAGMFSRIPEVNMIAESFKRQSYVA